MRRRSWGWTSGRLSSTCELGESGWADCVVFEESAPNFHNRTPGPFGQSIPPARYTSTSRDAVEPLRALSATEVNDREESASMMRHSAAARRPLHEELIRRSSRARRFRSALSSWTAFRCRSAMSHTSAQMAYFLAKGATDRGLDQARIPNSGYERTAIVGCGPRRKPCSCLMSAFPAGRTPTRS